MIGNFRLVSYAAIFLIAGYVLPANAETYWTDVIGIVDGDTIIVLHNSMPDKIRLQGIDCPEKSQAFGLQSKQFTARLAFAKEVTVVEKARDRYGRTIANVYLPDGQCLNKELVGAGLAWWYQKYAPEDIELRQIESRARQHKLGLWKDRNPIAPWEFRKLHR